MKIRVSAFFLVLDQLSFSSTQIIPLPKGPLGVASTTAELTNPNMLDPYAATDQARRVMLSAFYPTDAVQHCEVETIPYMPPGTAAVYDQMYSALGLPDGAFEALRLSVCRSPDVRSHRNSCRNSSQVPLILFSPGLGNSRLLHSVLAASVASEGIAVLTIDHPYDAAAVEFPDGTLVTAANITTDDQIAEVLAVRTKDVLFVLDQLHNRTFVQLLFNGHEHMVNIDQIFVAGHSLGDATAASAMLLDTHHQIKGGINLDGTFFGLVIDEGLDHPFMMFAHEGKNLSTDASWGRIWLKLSGSKLAVSVNGTVHGSFTDAPVLLDLLGVRDQLPTQVIGELVGTIDGRRVLDVLTKAFAIFTNFVGGKVPSGLFQELVGDFHEVEILESRFVV